MTLPVTRAECSAPVATCTTFIPSSVGTLSNRDSPESAADTKGEDYYDK